MKNISNDNFIKYIDARDEQILLFLENELSILRCNSKNSSFLISFYTTCLNMINNGHDLSTKQMDIIKREMKKKGVNIPTVKDFELRLTIKLSFEYKNSKYDNIDDIGDFYLLLSKNDDFNQKYELSFNSNQHIEDFHSSKGKKPITE